jgi:hypothetical protein
VSVAMSLTPFPGCHAPARPGFLAGPMVRR